MLDRKGGQIVEQAFAARDLRDEHHADQEEVDIETLGDTVQRFACGQEVAKHQCEGARDRPDRLGQAKGPDDDAGGCRDNDAPGEKRFVRWHRPVVSKKLKNQPDAILEADGAVRVSQLAPAPEYARV
jgi:hypothetical protein